MNPGNLYLIPSTLGGENPNDVLPPGIREILTLCNHFIVEDLRSARRFMKSLCREINIDEKVFFLLNKHTPAEEISGFLLPALAGQSTAVITEAGCPGIADPGASVTRLAHQKGIRVIPLVGPSSIILALMASGLNGQNFVFHGYLPIQQSERVKKIKDLERTSAEKNQTQIFIETPFRNNQMISDLLSTLKPGTSLCIAAGITLPDEMILTCSIQEWRNNQPDLNKIPAVFLFQAGS
jgi:16S rRNA (cytidine1402-2'-O)-methyltransferase